MEKLALRETIVLRNIQLLQDELALIRAEMEFVRKYLIHEPQRVILPPYAGMHKDKANPEQTAARKDSTNPLSPANSGKIQAEAQTSTTLGISSRPNGGIPIPNKTEGSTSARRCGWVYKSKILPCRV